MLTIGLIGSGISYTLVNWGNAFPTGIRIFFQDGNLGGQVIGIFALVGLFGYFVMFYNFFLGRRKLWWARLLGYLIFLFLTNSFRHLNKEPHNYTWWSYRANSRANNKGWRIDYNLVSEPLKENIKRAVILSEAVHSDHCPHMVELGF